MSRTLILGVTWPGKIKAMAKKPTPQLSLISNVKVRGISINVSIEFSKINQRYVHVVGNYYPLQGVPQFTSVFLVGFVLINLKFSMQYLWTIVLFFCSFSFGHCIVCLLAIVLSVFTRITATDYQYHLVSSNFFKMYSYTVEPVHAVTSIKQSPVLKGHIFLVLSQKILYELNLF